VSSGYRVLTHGVTRSHTESQGSITLGLENIRSSHVHRVSHRTQVTRVEVCVDAQKDRRPLDEPTWLTEGFGSRRKRGIGPDKWRCQWPNPRSPHSEW
jgi:hypothetical protein